MEIAKSEFKMLAEFLKLFYLCHPKKNLLLTINNFYYYVGKNSSAKTWV